MPTALPRPRRTPRATRVALLALCCALVACTGDAGSGGGRTATLEKPDPASLAATAPDSFTVTLQTSKGEIDLLVRRALAPRGADRLHWLATHGFFDGGRFFRVVPGFVVQFGLTGVPSVDKAWEDRSIPDDSVRTSNRRGTIVFATAGPDTRTTQLFINLADNLQLDAAGFAPVGEVRRGMDIVDQLHSAYGDGPPMGTGPDQLRIMREGNAYLLRRFPQLDSIIATRVAP